jgi:hypothetical protein
VNAETDVRAIPLYSRFLLPAACRQGSNRGECADPAGRAGRETEMRFFAIVDDDEAIELYVRREDAERFLAGVQADDRELADGLRLEPVDFDRGV